LARYILVYTAQIPKKTLNESIGIKLCCILG